MLEMVNLAKSIGMDANAIKADMGSVKRYTEEISRTVQNTVNNNATTTNVSFGDLNFTCNGVSAPEVLGEIQKALDQTFEGMALNAYQHAMAR